MTKKFIKNLDFKEISDFFLKIKEKDYRAKQLINWMYERNVESFSEMTNFSKTLRNFLDDNFIISPLKLCEQKISKIDSSEKFLFETLDGHYIESVLIRNEGDDDGRLTVCLSSQVGCAIGCKFCQTGKMGFYRNLEIGEIIDQLCQIRRTTGIKNNNIVFMGIL